MSTYDSVALAAFAGINLLTFCTFGFDKWRAQRSGRRIPEATLVLLGALGGWPGGLVAMQLFRHKTIKRMFQFKYALGLIPFAVEVWAYFHWR